MLCELDVDVEVKVVVEVPVDVDVVVLVQVSHVFGQWMSTRSTCPHSFIAIIVPVLHSGFRSWWQTAGSCTPLQFRVVELLVVVDVAVDDVVVVLVVSSACCIQMSLHCDGMPCCPKSPEDTCGERKPRASS